MADPVATPEDRPAPRTVAGEKQTLTDFLDYLRDAVVRKAEGVSEADARRSLVSSGTSLVRLLHHLADVERWWFHANVGGEEPPFEWTDDPPEDRTAAEVIAAYRAACEHSDQILATVDDLDRPNVAHTPELTLRWVLVHMLEETGRHAGHADILRELIDESTGR